MFITPSFKKSLIVEQFQGNYLNCVLTGIRAAIHRHLTLCSTQPKHKHFARQRIHICQQNACLKRRPSFLRSNAKPKHKSSIQSDMHKLNRYFMEGQKTDGDWKNAEKLAEFTICIGFRCVFILLAVAEKNGGSLQGSHLKQKLNLNLNFISPHHKYNGNNKK